MKEEEFKIKREIIVLKNYKFSETLRIWTN